MNSVKLLLLSASLSAFLCLLLLIWYESEASFDITTCKLLETMFAIASLVLMRDQAKISWKK